MNMPSTAPSTRLDVGVVMRRERVAGPMSQWQTWRWVLADVMPMDDLGLPPDVLSQMGRAPVAIEPQVHVDDEATHWLFPGHTVELFRDNVEGYYLNLTSPHPCFWVMWRLDPQASPDTLPEPLIVTLSYHDAGRWLDAQERVDQVPAPTAVLDWVAAYTEAHYIVEPKRRVRPVSFQPLADRFGNPVSISTDKTQGPQAGGGHGA